MNPLPRRTALVWPVTLLCLSCTGFGWFAAQAADNATAGLMVVFYALMGAGLILGVLRHSSPR